MTTKILLSGEVVPNPHGGLMLKCKESTFTGGQILALMGLGRPVGITITIEDEKTPGQIAYEAHPTPSTWEAIDPMQRQLWENTATAVLAWDAERRRKVVKDI